MAQVLLLSAAPREDDAFVRLRQYATQDRFGVHTLTSDPHEADLILFVESWGISDFFGEMRRHPFVRQFREKCFCFCERGHVVPFLPGIYQDVALRWYARDWVRGGFFLFEFTNPFATYEPLPEDAPYLYSFIGSVFTHKVREQVLQLRHPRGVVLDTTDDIRIWQHGSPEEKERYWKRYANYSKQSKFVLCPRGQSPGSVRLFDTMRMGRVPVILADQWIAPEGPNWSAFSIQVPERDVAKIPALLEELEPRCVEMGQRAREAWEEWFSEDVCFHRIVEWCFAIQQSERSPEPLRRLRPYLQLALSPKLLKSYVKHRAREVRSLLIS